MKEKGKQHHRDIQYPVCKDTYNSFVCSSAGVPTESSSLHLMQYHSEERSSCSVESAAEPAI